MGIKGQLIMGFICISLTNYVEHLFICFLVICISSLEKSLLKCFGHFLTEMLVFLLLNYKFLLYFAYSTLSDT